MLLLVLKAVLVGFVMSITSLGPSKLIAMQRTFVYGPKNGLTLAAGSVLVDTLYALIPAIGMTFWAFNISDMRPWVDYLFILMALGFGGYFTLANMTTAPKEGDRMKAAGAFGIGFGLNFINPGNIAGVTAGFAMLNVAVGGLSITDACILAVGVGVGSLLAWWLQIYLLHYLRDHFNEKRLNFIIRAFGFLLAVAGGAYLGYMVADYIDLI